MNRFDRIYALHRLLKGARVPIPRQRLEEELECSRSTLNRLIREMRDYLGAPIVYDRERGGYIYAPGENYELPGLWFSASELYALLAIDEILDEVQPGLLGEALSSLRKRIQTLLKTPEGIDIAGRIHFLPSATRPIEPARFQAVADALLKRNRLFIRYHGREKDKETQRTVSPQRLTFYRDNWYLDAYCHLKEGLRRFSLDRILDAQTLSEPALEISEAELKAYFESAYGVFAGEPRYTAVLRFTPGRARWVADERWHPEQKGHFLEDGRYELRIPFSDPRELIL
ncbi:MAG: WYL domain-containing protein, partial [Gammaproteobacteria bacterium]